MAKTMTASKTVTDGQIENAVGKLRDAMRKHRSEINSDLAQQVLGVDNLGMKMFATFRDIAEAMSRFVTRTVTVDRSLSAAAALSATGRRQDVIVDVLLSMPQGTDKTVMIHFIPLERQMSDGEVDAKLAEHGLVSVDPYALMAHNANEPDFAEEYPNFAYWKDGKGDSCYVAFDGWGGERCVRVRRYSSGWGGDWWAAGVRISAQP